MTKAQITLNIIFFVPLMVINFFVYGIDGCIDFVKDLKKYLIK